MTPLFSLSPAAPLSASQNGGGLTGISLGSGSGLEFASLMGSFCTHEADFSLQSSANEEQQPVLSIDKPATFLRLFGQALSQAVLNPQDNVLLTPQTSHAIAAEDTETDKEDGDCGSLGKILSEPDEQPAPAQNKSGDYAVEVPVPFVFSVSEPLPVRFASPGDGQTKEPESDRTHPVMTAAEESLQIVSVKPPPRSAAPHKADPLPEPQLLSTGADPVFHQEELRAPETKTLTAPVLPEVTPTYMPSKAPLALQVHLVPAPSHQNTLVQSVPPQAEQAPMSVPQSVPSTPVRLARADSHLSTSMIQVEAADATPQPGQLTVKAVAKAQPATPSDEQTESQESKQRSPEPANTKQAQPTAEPPQLAAKQPGSNPGTVTVPHTAQPHKPPSATEMQKSAAPQQTDIPEAAPQRTEPARDIGFRMSSPHSGAVDIKVIERAGQIRVSVHSADPAITRSLQDNVSELTGKLERSAFQAETFTPGLAQPAPGAPADNLFQQSPRDRKAPQYEQNRNRKNRSQHSEFKIEMFTDVRQENS